MISDLRVASKALEQEAAAILLCAQSLGEPFESAVSWIVECKGRVITCGVGKSGHIARKTAGTLSSTGTPSFFLHAAEAVHGDLGMVTERDVVLLYTHSGETDELIRLFPSIRTIGAKTILVTGRAKSTAAQIADLVLDTKVTEEACPNNLAPTTSTTVMLALSDAIAIAAMERRGFSKEDFAKFHPSGTLGKRLLLRVKDVARPLEECAVVSPQDYVIEVIRGMTDTGSGAALVFGDEGFEGIITESNLRRHLLSQEGGLSGEARDMMNESPLLIESDLLAIEAFEVFQNHPVKIGEIPVTEQGKVVGLLTLKDLLRSGIV